MVKGGWNTVVGSAATGTQRERLCHCAGVASGRRWDSGHLVAMLKEQITNTGVIPAMASVDDGYSGRRERGTAGSWGQSGKHRRSQRQEPHRGAPMEEPALPTARAERSAIESLVFTLKEGFEFGEMVRRTNENVLAEMLEKRSLAYNISQIIRVRKKLSELQDMQLAAA